MKWKAPIETTIAGHKYREGDRLVYATYDQFRDRDDSEVVRVCAIYVHRETGEKRIYVTDDTGVKFRAILEKIIRRA